VAKQSGLLDQAFVAGYDLSGDIQALGTIRDSQNLLDVTAINVSAMERIRGIRDGEISFTSFFNDAVGQEHAILKTVPSTDTHVMYFRGSTLGNPVAAMVGKQVDYAMQRGADGSLIFNVQALSNGFGLHQCFSLTAGKRTDTVATNGTSVDDLAGSPTSTAFGMSAYFQLFSFAGTSVTITISDSADNSSFASITGLATSALTSAPQQVFLQTATGATIRRYIRVVTTGTFSSAVFAVAVTRHRDTVI
jgi:hypothetical protein